MLLSLLNMCLLASSLAATDWSTEFERSNGRLTATYDQTIEYCRRLDSASKWIRFESFGKSGEGRDLPLLIVDKDGDFSPERAHKHGKAIVLVQAGIHSGEIDGKDAGLMLIREMAITRERESLLDHVTFVFIPIYNVDGHEHVHPYNRVNQDGPENAGFRANATALNLNRDYMKADAPETRAWLALWNRWNPDFFADCHVTDGADYPYVVTYFVETSRTADPGVAAWTRDRYVPALEPAMRQSGFPLMYYCDFRKPHDPRSGFKTGASTPRFSTGYVALANRPALLIETHMFKDYATRVKGTHAMLLHTLEIVGRDASQLLHTNADADARTVHAAADFDTLALSIDVSDRDSVMIDFEGYEYTAVKSDLTGGTWHRFGKTPVTMKIPHFATHRVTAKTTLPAKYYIPPQWTEIIARLEMHGVELTRLEAPVTTRVTSYRLSKPSWAQEPFEGHHAVKFTTERTAEERTFPAGTVVVDTAQRRAKIAAGLLEPEAPDALVKWGFLDTIFEAKEYVESYVMEGIARDMLKDASLASQWKQAQADTTLMGRPQRIRDWFYQRSRFAETRVGVYPVGRVSLDTNAR
jgi:murein tripeptide amidase MpaA